MHHRSQPFDCTRFCWRPPSSLWNHRWILSCSGNPWSYCPKKIPPPTINVEATWLVSSVSTIVETIEYMTHSVTDVSGHRFCCCVWHMCDKRIVMQRTHDIKSYVHVDLTGMLSLSSGVEVKIRHESIEKHEQPPSEVSKRNCGGNDQDEGWWPADRVPIAII